MSAFPTARAESELDIGGSPSGDEELVDLFLARSKTDRSGAHLCFEIVIARYNWLISHVVRSSRFRFPAWDSADDVIARVIFKVYRGLVQWRRQGKLSSFIARIASSEMIDTIRRVGRDKSWYQYAAAADSRLGCAFAGLTWRGLASRRRSSVDEQRAARNCRPASCRVCKDWKDSVIVNEYIIGNQNAKEICAKYRCRKTWSTSGPAD